MNLILGLSVHAGRRLAEVGFLLFVIAGVWLAVAQLPQFKAATWRTIVVGVALAVGGALLVVATRWGHFG